MADLVSYFDRLAINGTPSLEQNSVQSYKFELIRLRSFEEWPRENPAFALRLAETGFYYKGTIDLVECYFCKATKQNWKKEDSPRKVHESLNPRCPFIQNPGNTDNVPVDLTKADDLPESFNRINSLLVADVGEGSGTPVAESAPIPPQSERSAQAVPQPGGSQRSNVNQPAPGGVTVQVPGYPVQEPFTNRVPGRVSEPITSGGERLMSDPSKPHQQFRLGLGM